MQQVWSHDPDTCFIRVKHICQYLHHTLGYALRYVPTPPQSKHKLWVLGDASFTPTGETSQQGLIVYHGITSHQRKGGNLVQWRSSRQDLIAKSTCEAELIASSEARRQARQTLVISKHHLGRSSSHWLRGRILSKWSNYCWLQALQSDVVLSNYLSLPDLGSNYIWNASLPSTSDTEHDKDALVVKAPLLSATFLQALGIIHSRIVLPSSDSKGEKKNKTYCPSRWNHTYQFQYAADYADMLRDAGSSSLLCHECVLSVIVQLSNKTQSSRLLIRWSASSVLSVRWSVLLQCMSRRFQGLSHCPSMPSSRMRSTWSKTSTTSSPSQKVSLRYLKPGLSARSSASQQIKGTISMWSALSRIVRISSIMLINQGVWSTSSGWTKTSSGHHVSKLSMSGTTSPAPRLKRRHGHGKAKTVRSGPGDLPSVLRAFLHIQQTERIHVRKSCDGSHWWSGSIRILLVSKPTWSASIPSHQTAGDVQGWPAEVYAMDRDDPQYQSKDFQGQAPLLWILWYEQPSEVRLQALLQTSQWFRIASMHIVQCLLCSISLSKGSLQWRKWKAKFGSSWTQACEAGSPSARSSMGTRSSTASNRISKSRGPAASGSSSWPAANVRSYSHDAWYAKWSSRFVAKRSLPVHSWASSMGTSNKPRRSDSSKSRLQSSHSRTNGVVLATCFDNGQSTQSKLPL